MLFCEEHVGYQMRLSPNTEHNPDVGFWFRVCFECYTSREGYNDVDGATTDHSLAFLAARQVHADKIVFEARRLEKRLENVDIIL